MPLTLDWGIPDKSARPQPADRRSPVDPAVAAAIEAANDNGETFAIVARNVLLRDHSERMGVPSRTRGDIARLSTLSGGRLVARWSTPWADGTPAWSCATYDPSRPVESVECPEATDWGAWVNAQIEAKPGGWHPLEPNAQDREIARFVAQWPAVAERLNLEAQLGPFRLFSPGPVRYPKTTAAGAFPADFWRAFVESRHCIGDFGIYGEENGVRLLEDQVWTIGEQPVEVQNTHAIQTGFGAVRSRYVLEGELQGRFPKSPAIPTRRPTVDVITTMARSGVQTLCTIGAVDVF